VTADPVVFPGRPTWVAPQPAPDGRPQARCRPADGGPPPVPIGEPAGRLERRKVTWREGTEGRLAARFARVRVGPGRGRRRGGGAGAEAVGLPVEERADGQLTYALSNPPAGASCRQAVRLWKSGWPAARGYRQREEDLGLDHVEGRSWRGSHHPAATALPAYGLPLLERLAAPPAPPRRGKRGARG
jgi:SRSO17 transposase